MTVLRRTGVFYRGISKALADAVDKLDAKTREIDTILVRGFEELQVIIEEQNAIDNQRRVDKIIKALDI